MSVYSKAPKTSLVYWLYILILSVALFVVSFRIQTHPFGIVVSLISFIILFTRIQMFKIGTYDDDLYYRIASEEELDELNKDSSPKVFPEAQN